MLCYASPIVLEWIGSVCMAGRVYSIVLVSFTSSLTTQLPFTVLVT